MEETVEQLRARAVELSGLTDLTADEFGRGRGTAFVAEGWAIFRESVSGPAPAPCDHAGAFGFDGPGSAWHAFIKAWTEPNDCYLCVHDVPVLPGGPLRCSQ